MAAELSPTPGLTVSVVPNRHEVVVVPAGELDLSCVDLIEDHVRALRATGFERVVIDLRRLTFIDSSGLRILLALRNDAKRRGQDLTLIRGPRPVQRLFELTGTTGLFAWRDL